jgi:hypothetical protein
MPLSSYTTCLRLILKVIHVRLPCGAILETSVAGVCRSSTGCCVIERTPNGSRVFEGNTLDHQTVLAQIEKPESRFDLRRVVFASDRGMVTTANLAALRERRIDWITALKAPQVKALNAAGALPLSLFDQRNLAEIDHADYPHERLVVCRNPLLAAERARKREELLRATEAKLRPPRCEPRTIVRISRMIVDQSACHVQAAALSMLNSRRDWPKDITSARRLEHAGPARRRSRGSRRIDGTRVGQRS